MAFLGDDSALCGVSPSPVVHLLYGGATLDPAEPDIHAGAGSLAPVLAAASDGKRLLLPSRPGGGAPAVAVSLRAILLPRIAGQRQTTVTPVAAAEVLRRLTPSTLVNLPGAQARSFANLAALARSVPGYDLALGWERAAIPVAIAGLLEELDR